MFRQVSAGIFAPAITFAWGAPVAPAVPCFIHGTEGGGEARASRDSAWKGRPL
jgi:hypothetical protein